MKGTHVRATRTGGYQGATSKLKGITIDGNRIEPSKRQISLLKQNTKGEVPKEKEGQNLLENGHFILASKPKIEQLIEDLLNYNNEVITDKTIEIEARLLNTNTNKIADKFRRSRDWLKDKFKSASIKVEENSFYEIISTVSMSQLVDKSHTIQYVTRNGVTHMKVKTIGSTRKGGEYIILPNILEIQPRLGVSLESDMKINDLSGIETESVTRNRTRWSFIIDSPKIYLYLTAFQNMGVDIAKISGQNIRGRIDVTRSETVGNIFIDYSVEVELENTDENGDKILFDKITVEQMDFLDGWIKILSIVMNRSGSLMTTGEGEALSFKFNAILGEGGIFIPRRIVNKPKDLQKHDLAWLKPQESDFFMQLNEYDNDYDQIMTTFQNRRVFMPLMAVDGGYYVSLKADGNRYFFFMDESGFYLINPLASILTKISGTGTQYSDLRYNNTMTKNIFDCELVLDEEYLETFNTSGVSPKYNILIFDILAHEGKDVRGLPYFQRLELIGTIIGNFYKQENIVNISSFLNIAIKVAIKLPSPVHPKVLIDENQNNLTKVELAQQFFFVLDGVIQLNRVSSTGNGKQTTKCLNGKEFSWKTDGLIFTPAARPYLESDDRFYQMFGNNDNPNYSLVRKWKELLTIDFLVRRNASNVITIMSYSSKNSTKQGDFPFDGRIGIPWNGNVELDNSMLERIFEFRWGFSEKFLDYAFIPVRERTDRDTANDIRTARDVWTLINDPIQYEDLTSQSLSLMRRYHNRVKATLLSLLVAKFQNPCLLDLGSGRGGDISKWNLFDIVYAVEPDEKNLRDFLSRLEERNRFNSAIVSETEEIILQEADRLNKQKESSIKISIADQQFDQTNVLISQNAIVAHYSRISTLLSRSILKTIKTEANTNVLIKRLMVNNKITRGLGGEKPKQERAHIIPINSPAENINRLLDNIPIGVVNCCTMFNALTFFYESREKLQLMIDTVKTFLTQGGYFSVVALDGELLLNSMQNPSQQKTEGNEEVITYNTIKTKNITISKAPDPSCRKIFIKIEGGIVRGQYEYLIQLREFVQIMNDNGFRLIDERYLNEETLLSQEEYWFSSMFKLLQFRYSIPTLEQEVKIAAQNNPEISLSEIKQKIEIENFGKRIIEKMEADRALRPLSPSDPPQAVKSTKFADVGNLVRIGVPQDGSCYIHGIMRAFSKIYKDATISERQNIILQVRKDMSQNYTREMHDAIGDGFFKTSQYPAYSYDNIKNAIASSTYWIDQQLMGFIGDQLQTNVYIMRGIDPDVYNFGNAAAHIKSGRKNIVLYWVNDNHYEVIGVIEGNNLVRTVFPDDHPLIQAFK